LLDAVGAKCISTSARAFMTVEKSGYGGVLLENLTVLSPGVNFLA
jgi:hypothetical protein